MTDLALELARIRDDLDALGRPWALVGALAVVVYGEARATLDVDVAVSIDGVSDGDSLLAALRERGYLWQSSMGHAMTSLVVPDSGVDGLRLDLVFSLSGIEGEVARAAERVEILPRLVLPVARRGHLVALKLLAAREPLREHDRRDLRSILRNAAQADLDVAREALSLLARRGAASRGDLERDLEALLEDLG